MSDQEIKDTLIRLSKQSLMAAGCPLIKDSVYREPWSESGHYDFRVGDFLIKDLKRDDYEMTCVERPPTPAAR